MKALQFSIVAGGALLLASSCASTKVTYLETFSPEESSLNMIKITDESNNSVAAGTSARTNPYDFNNLVNTPRGISRKHLFFWNTHNVLALSPDGQKLAYCTTSNRQDNIMVRNTGAQGTSTQRTFRNVHSFSWGNDGKLYFSDINGNRYYICSVNAEAGSMMDQLTNGNVNDVSPVLSSDGKTIFFTRSSNGAPSIWSLNRENGTLTSCANGFSPCLIPDNNEAFYCVRNTSNGRSEIWFVNFVKGQESLVLSDEDRSFTNPQLSPDGQWLVCVGNSLSNITKKQNLDIYAVRTDGSRLTQLTFHPATDTCPVWSKDGKSIYFVSSRANKNNAFNVWKMNFNLQ